MFIVITLSRHTDARRERFRKVSTVCLIFYLSLSFINAGLLKRVRVSLCTISSVILTVPEELRKVSVKVTRVISVLSNGKSAVTLIYDVTFHTRYHAATPFIPIKKSALCEFFHSFS